MLMRRDRAAELRLGCDVVQMLLPHRRPFLMVDRVVTYSRESMTLEAERYVSANEPVFEGHFPELQIWPGVYTVEGLGQSCNLLLVIAGMQERTEEMGFRPEDALDVLQNIDRGFRLDPRFDPELVAPLSERMSDFTALIGLSAAVDVKFKGPVFAGSCLQYRVQRTHEIGEMVRFDVEAEVEREVVASGRMTVRTGIALPRLGPLA